MQIPIESQCPKGFLHDFIEARERKTAFTEICKNCGHKAVYGKDAKGRMDNRLYLRAHYRSFVQPRGSGSNAFRKAFGEKAWRAAVKSRAYRPRHDWQTAGENAHRMLAEMRKEKTSR